MKYEAKGKKLNLGVPQNSYEITNYVPFDASERAAAADCQAPR